MFPCKWSPSGAPCLGGGGDCSVERKPWHSVKTLDYFGPNSGFPLNLLGDSVCLTSSSWCKLNIYKMKSVLLETGNKPNRKMSKKKKKLNRHVTAEETFVTKKQIKRCSASLVIREMQVQTTMRYHFTPTSLATTKKCCNSKWWKEWEWVWSIFQIAGVFSYRKQSGLLLWRWNFYVLHLVIFHSTGL